MTKRITSVEVADRPYNVCFMATGATYPMVSEEVRRLVANYPATACSASRLTLRADDGRNVVIFPSTLGGGRAFVAVRA